MSIEGFSGPFTVTLVLESKRTPADDVIDKLRDRKREIERKLGPDACELRSELKGIDAAITAFDKAKPKTTATKRGKR